MRRLGAALVVAISVVAGCGSGGDGDADRLPAVTLPSLDGADELDFDELTGPAVVNLWATWCKPCERELPEFEAVHQERGDSVRFIGVNIGDAGSAAARFLDARDVTYDQYLDYEGELSSALGTASLPITIVVDADGAISTRHIGPLDRDGLIDAIESAQA